MTVGSPAARLGLFVALLALVFVVAFGIGQAGSTVRESPPMEVEHGQHD